MHRSLFHGKKFGALAALVAVVMLVLAACGSQPQESSVSELVIAQGTDPQTLDPHGSTVQQALNISMAIAEPLIYLNYETGELEPLLAESWEPIGENVWEIRLRQGISFTNGEPFTAEAVKFSLERVGLPELASPATIYIRPIQDVRVADDYTVHIITDGPSPVIPLYLTRIGMVPPQYVTENGHEIMSQQPVGTGPYKLVSWQKDERVVLEANPDYWRGAPTIDRIVFRSIPEASTRVAALRAGEADIIAHVPLEEVDRLGEGLSVATTPSLRTMMLDFDLLDDGPQQDRRVRQALNYAIDVDAIVNNVLAGYGRKLDGQPISAEYFGYSDEIEAYPYDPDRARALLAEAGYDDSNPLRLTFYATNGRYLRDQEVAQAITGQFSQVGVQVDLQILEWGQFLQRMLDRALEPLAMWGAATVPDADVWLGSMLTCGAAYSTYCNEELDELVRQAGRELDTQRRREIYAEVLRLIHEEAPYVFLYQQYDVWGVSDRVSGFVPMPDESINLWNIRVN